MEISLNTQDVPPCNHTGCFNLVWCQALGLVSSCQHPALSYQHQNEAMSKALPHLMCGCELCVMLGIIMLFSKLIKTTQIKEEISIRIEKCFSSKHMTNIYITVELSDEY